MTHVEEEEVASYALIRNVVTGLRRPANPARSSKISANSLTGLDRCTTPLTIYMSSRDWRYWCKCGRNTYTDGNSLSGDAEIRAPLIVPRFILPVYSCLRVSISILKGDGDGGLAPSIVKSSELFVEKKVVIIDGKMWREPSTVTYVHAVWIIFNR
jgi:hypothetical protein